MECEQLEDNLRKQALGHQACLSTILHFSMIMQWSIGIMALASRIPKF